MDNTQVAAPATQASGISIAAVERDTGLGKDTLRVWERRYGFPHHDRDQFGERVYPIEQVDKLRVLRRLMDGGHRPGKVINLQIEQLQAQLLHLQLQHLPSKTNPCPQGKKAEPQPAPRLFIWFFGL